MSLWFGGLSSNIYIAFSLTLCISYRSFILLAFAFASVSPGEIPPRAAKLAHAAHKGETCDVFVFEPNIRYSLFVVSITAQSLSHLSAAFLCIALRGELASIPHLASVLHRLYNACRWVQLFVSCAYVERTMYVLYPQNLIDPLSITGMHE